MSCDEIENKVLEYQENQLSPTQREEVENHLAACAGCRIFAGQIIQLDAALSARIEVPALSADFDRRLHQRIQAAPAMLSEAQRAERKRQLQAEFEAGMAQIRRVPFTWDSLVKHLTWPALALVAGWLTWRFTLPLAVRLNAQILGGLEPVLLPCLAASAVFLAISLPQAFPHQRKLLGF